MKFSLPWFTVAFSVAYIFVFAMDLALFLYYPLVGEFHLGEARGAVGPAMHWYGLVASAAIVGGATGLFARDHWIPSVLIPYLWLAPLATLMASAFLLRNFFA